MRIVGSIKAYFDILATSEPNTVSCTISENCSVFIRNLCCLMKSTVS